MNGFSQNAKSKNATPELKRFGLSSAIAGALTGVLAVLSLSFFYRSIGLVSLGAGFLYPGYLALEKLDPVLKHPSSLATFFIYDGVSCIPPAIIGAFIFSYRTVPRISGFVLLVIYAILWLFFSLFLHVMAD